jgi:hypothetical protein
VTTVDPSTIRLQGVIPLRYSLEDVGRPMADPPDECNCTTEGPDGYLDLVLHFDVQAILDTLEGPPAVDTVETRWTPRPPWIGLQYFVFLPKVTVPPPREQYVLTLTAALWSGATVTGQDCILVIGDVVTEAR